MIDNSNHPFSEDPRVTAACAKSINERLCHLIELLAINNPSYSHQLNDMLSTHRSNIANIIREEDKRSVAGNGIHRRLGRWVNTQLSDNTAIRDLPDNTKFTLAERLYAACGFDKEKDQTITISQFFYLLNSVFTITTEDYPEYQKRGRSQFGIPISSDHPEFKKSFMECMQGLGFTFKPKRSNSYGSNAEQYLAVEYHSLDCLPSDEQTVRIQFDNVNRTVKLIVSDNFEGNVSYHEYHGDIPISIWLKIKDGLEKMFTPDERVYDTDYKRHLDFGQREVNVAFLNSDNLLKPLFDNPLFENFPRQNGTYSIIDWFWKNEGNKTPEPWIVRTDSRGAAYIFLRYGNYFVALQSFTTMGGNVSFFELNPSWYNNRNYDRQSALFVVKHNEVPYHEYIKLVDDLKRIVYALNEDPATVVKLSSPETNEGEKAD